MPVNGYTIRKQASVHLAEVATGSGVDYRIAMQVLASDITMPIFITTFTPPIRQRLVVVRVRPPIMGICNENVSIIFRNL
jgi:hypothetical protein